MSRNKKNTKKHTHLVLAGVVIGFSLMIIFNSVWTKTSTSESCISCHAHPESDANWKQSYHYNNDSGTKTDCAACHLPEKGSFQYAKAKIRMGMKDVWSYVTKDLETIDWDRKGELEYARNIVYNESCKECHVNLFPQGVTDDGIKAHLYYEENEKKLDLQCISCHLDAGHYNPDYQHGTLKNAPKLSGTIHATATQITAFADFTETVPGTTASISLKAIPGGEFMIGSPEDEPFRKSDEGPQKLVKISPFFMGEYEITWNQFWAFYLETMSEGRTPPSVIYANNTRKDIDAVSGPTPPFGIPDQGWGMGDRPAITLTHYSAETFCQWLSLKTGKKYRLPTEAEWEYAARGGTSTPYFFEGKPSKFSNEGFLKSIFKADTTVINSYAVYANNSSNRTQEPAKVKANQFGLKNMLGNVMEYCSDWYDAKAYEAIKDGQRDPKGPKKGTEHVVRGGLYNSDAADLRSAARSHTEHDAWLKTDPQHPKSIWWYSDVKGIGFRVVCEVPADIKTN